MTPPQMRGIDIELLATTCGVIRMRNPPTREVGRDPYFHPSPTNLQNHDPGHLHLPMWSPFLRPGLTLVQGDRRTVRVVAQEVTHAAIHTQPRGRVLWCDGDHGFNPYDYAELNLVRGHEADAGADRVLIKRCMTPFQWDSVLTQHLKARLEEEQQARQAAIAAGEEDPPGIAAVIIAPFNSLFATDELEDWEQDGYVRFALTHLRALARRHRIPILIGCDIGRWRMASPALAHLTVKRADHHWLVRVPADGRLVVEEVDGDVLGDGGFTFGLVETLQTSLDDFVGEAGQVDEAGPGHWTGPEEPSVRSGGETAARSGRDAPGAKASWFEMESEGSLEVLT